MASENNQPHPIEISVVVPVRNEERSMRVLLERLLSQTLAPDEIVITDGGSTDGTRSIIEEFIEQGAPAKLIREERSMPGRARNQAVKHSRNEWIAFTDAGIKPETDWLATLARRVDEDATIDVVYGSYEPVISSFFEECAAIAYVPPPLQTDRGPARPISIVSALMRRKVWEAVKGFPEDLRSAEDLLFMRRVEQSGFRIVREPAAVVHWNIQPTLWGTFRRFVAYARNNIRAGLWREWQAPIFLRYALILAWAIPAFVLGAWWLLVPLGWWLAFIVARALKSIYRNRGNYPAGPWRNAGRLVVLIPILTAIDAAAFAGTVDWLLRDKVGLRRAKPNNEPRR